MKRILLKILILSIVLFIYNNIFIVDANGQVSNLKELGISEYTSEEYFGFNFETGAITGYSDKGPKDVIIPTEIKGVPVISIGVMAFSSKLLSSVIIPEGVTNIKRSAFYNNKLTKVTIPDSVTYLGDKAFAFNKLTSVIILNKEMSFDNNVFLINPPDLIVYGLDLSTAKTFAEKYGYTFVNLYPEVTFKDYDGSILKTETVSYGEGAIAPTDPIRTDYTFIGWDVDFSNVTESLIVTSQYNINEYIVSFNSQGGSDIESITVYHNSNIIKPKPPTKEGHTFIDWYNEVECINLWDFDTNKVEKNMTVYAKWLSNDDIVMVSNLNNVLANDNFSEIFTLSIQNNTVKQPIDALDLSLSGVFENLNVGQVNNNSTTVTASVYGKLSDTGVGTITLNPDKLAIKINPLYVDINVSAISKYTVTFIDWNGTKLKEEDVIYENNATAPTDPKRKGYTFTGWDVDFSNVTSDLTVIAEYREKEYIVTFEDYNGSVLKTETVTYGRDIASPTDPKRAGYTFTGWDREFTNVTSDLTIIATYKKNIRNSTSDTETRKEEQTVNKGTVIEKEEEKVVTKTIIKTPSEVMEITVSQFASYVSKVVKLLIGIDSKDTLTYEEAVIAIRNFLIESELVNK